MIASGRRNDTDLWHVAQQKIGKGSARLERAGMLNEFQLQGDLRRVEAKIAPVDLDHGRAPDIGPDDVLGGLDALAAYGVQ